MRLQKSNLMTGLGGFGLLDTNPVAAFTVPSRVSFPKDLPAQQRELHRRIAFNRVWNFRDLGGYLTRDGYSVKWGTLYRSSHLHDMTVSDQAAFVRLGLSRVIDFRAGFEKEAQPDRLPAGFQGKVVEIPILDDNSALGKDLQERIGSGQLDGLDPVGYLTDANIQFATRFTRQFRQFVREVLEANGAPVLFHCTSGKDRTGFASALLLRILGVSDAIVFNDYLLSSRYSLEAHKREIFMVQLAHGQAAAECVRQLCLVEPDYLSAGLSAIDQKYRTFENYVHIALGLSGEDVEQLRRAYLE